MFRHWSFPEALRPFGAGLINLVGCPAPRRPRSLDVTVQIDYTAFAIEVGKWKKPMATYELQITSFQHQQFTYESDCGERDPCKRYPKGVEYKVLARTNLAH